MVLPNLGGRGPAKPTNFAAASWPRSTTRQYRTIRGCSRRSGAGFHRRARRVGFGCPTALFRIEVVRVQGSVRRARRPGVPLQQRGALPPRPKSLDRKGPREGIAAAYKHQDATARVGRAIVDYSEYSCHSSRKSPLSRGRGGRTLHVGGFVGCPLSHTHAAAGPYSAGLRTKKSPKPSALAGRRQQGNQLGPKKTVLTGTAVQDFVMITILIKNFLVDHGH